MGSALAFVAAGFGAAVVSQPVERMGPTGVVFRELTSRHPVRMPMKAVWNPHGVSAPIASRFVSVLGQACTASPVHGVEPAWFAGAGPPLFRLGPSPKAQGNASKAVWAHPVPPGGTVALA